MKKTILTGIRPTGNIHLGHYFGAIKNWVILQNEYDSYFEIADVQALTDNFDNPEKVRKNIYELTIDLLSVGINPDKATIFIQSMIPEIPELTIYFSNLVTVARLYRNPTIKTEINQKKGIFGNDGESVTYGFLGYPINQAADIIALNGELIPVGDDQLPLIEQCREIIKKFNHIYGETIKMPEAYLSKNSRIKGLDGNEKMGKSLGNALYLCDSDEAINDKIMAAITDKNKIKKDDKANPEICMVYYYHKLLGNDNVETVCLECKEGQRGCVACKKELISNMHHFLKPIREKREYYVNNPNMVNDILIEGTKKAREKASQNLDKIKENMKINYFK